MCVYYLRRLLLFVRSTSRGISDSGRVSSGPEVTSFCRQRPSCTCAPSPFTVTSASPIHCACVVAHRTAATPSVCCCQRGPCRQPCRHRSSFREHWIATRSSSSFSSRRQQTDPRWRAASTTEHSPSTRRWSRSLCRWPLWWQSTSGPFRSCGQADDATRCSVVSSTTRL